MGTALSVSRSVNKNVSVNMCDSYTEAQKFIAAFLSIIYVFTVFSVPFFYWSSLEKDKPGLMKSAVEIQTDLPLQKK